MAGPFEENDYLRLIREDKRLDPGWVRSLFERGAKQTYKDRKSLAHIGMPIGGFFAGTVYLAGDGRLCLWDIFNQQPQGIAPRQAAPMQGIGNAPVYLSGLNYLDPAPMTQPFKQGFKIEIGDRSWALDRDGFEQVTFDGRYPIGRISYRDASCPLEIELEAFSPFIPLNTDDSSLPATVMAYTVHNPTDDPVELSLRGYLENAVCMFSGAEHHTWRRNEAKKDDLLAGVFCSAIAPRHRDGDPRPDIVFDDFERENYGDKWKAEGVAFGNGPIVKSSVPAYQGDLGGEGERVVNSHASAPGDDTPSRDSQTGTLTSDPFRISRRYIRMLVGGGDHAGKTCVNVIIGDKVVGTVTGDNNNHMKEKAIDVSAHEGKEARLQIVDLVAEGWGNIGVDHIVFSDRHVVAEGLDKQLDYGTMALALLHPTPEDVASSGSGEAQADKAWGEPLVGSVGRKLRLKSKESARVTFVVTWRFPNLYGHGQWFRGQRLGHWYAARFESAEAVARYVAEHFERLAGDTRKWVDTWYDSTLPYWLLDRTMANTSTLATTTCYRHENGRYWAWEGVGCCPGTCTHVWHYAQSPGRLFPAMERDQREKVDFGLAFDPNSGSIHYRAEVHNHHADDGQCGRILGVYREHQMSPDDGFLKRVWPRVKKAVEFMIARDGDADGILNGAQPNTLDAAWFGKVSFTSSLYLAALKASEAMAKEMSDEAFAATCGRIAEIGARSILELYDGEYFIQIEDPQHANEIGIGKGCYIDQVFGQTWSHWVNLGRLFDRDKQRSALRSLWRYNFVPDVGPFRDHFKRGRWYASAGDAGMIMCSWPKGGKSPAFEQHWQFMYFNECMSGFEWQVAAHMIWEGIDDPDLLKCGLAVSRAVHDRYDARLRNPYNEIECSDHYARAMASYGVFQAVCGFQCHGPSGHIEFSPRLNPANFKAAFTCATGWGTIAQVLNRDVQIATVTLRWGSAAIRTLALHPCKGVVAGKVKVTQGSQPIDATIQRNADLVTVTLSEQVVVEADQTLTVELR